MSENIQISIFEIVGSPICVASDDGEKIYKHLDAALSVDQNVVLSFHNVTALTGAFLSTALGQLYGTFSEEKILSLLKIEDTEPDDLRLLKSVINNAKLYFKDPERFNQVVREVMGDDDDDITTIAEVSI